MKKFVFLIICMFFLSISAGLNLIETSEAEDISYPSMAFIWDNDSNILLVVNSEPGYYYAGPNITDSPVNESYYESANLVFLKNWETYYYVNSNMSITDDSYPSNKEIESGDKISGFTEGTYTIIWKSTGLIFLNFTVKTESEENQDEDLIAYWNFDEDEGIEINDNSGNNNSASNSGCEFTNGISGKGLEILDTDIARNIPNSFDDEIENQFTITCWVKWYGEHPNTFSKNSYIFDCREDAWDGGGFILFITEDGSVKFRTVEVDDNQIVESNSKIKSGKWVHIAVVFNHDNQKLSLFINGVEDNHSATYKEYSNTNYNAVIGNNHWAPGDHEWAPLNGVIDELKIYKIALSDTNIESLYLMHKPEINDTTPVNNSSDDAVDNVGIPGFEMILVIVTLAFFIVRKRKK